MEIIYMMLALSVVLAGCFIYAFFWAADHNQFSDLYSPKWRILNDDEEFLKDDGEEDGREARKL